MLALGLFECEPDIGDEDLIELLSSNLCRCTGYQGIVAAVRAAFAEMREARR
jgi:carbon-monoxide dehydrogenase small subunit